MMRDKHLAKGVHLLVDPERTDALQITTGPLQAPTSPGYWSGVRSEYRDSAGHSQRHDHRHLLRSDGNRAVSMTTLPSALADQFTYQRQAWVSRGQQ